MAAWLPKAKRQASPASRASHASSRTRTGAPETRVKRAPRSPTVKGHPGAFGSVAPPPAASPHPSATTTPIPTHANSDNDNDNDDERTRILAMLDETRWNRSEAARRLGMTLRQLRYRLQKWGME